MHHDYPNFVADIKIAAQSGARCLLTVAALALVMSCICRAPAQAGVIPLAGGVAGVVGGGTASITGPFTPMPNNFPSAIAANFAAVQKTFLSSDTPIDIVFNVDNSQGVTEYLFAEGVFNASGVAWNDYHIQLGTGTGDGFVLANPALGLQFDSTPAPSSADFTSAVLLPQTLAFSNGLIPASSGLSLSFTVDVPDIGDNPGYQFTLRQFPSVVPEPTSMALFGLGAIGFCAAALRRRRSHRA